MPLNPQKGNMYKHITHTWNPIKGLCQHDCLYCYMKVFKQRPLRLVESELKTDLGEGNFIFVGSSTDMCEENVPTTWIANTLDYCNQFPDNQYLFQSKNPFRFIEFLEHYPPGSHFATTIESNRNYPAISSAPPVEERKRWIGVLGHAYPISITIEPVLDFDVDMLASWIHELSPEWVAIGADSKGHKLPEPTPEKVRSLVLAISDVPVIIKRNLRRIVEIS